MKSQSAGFQFIPNGDDRESWIAVPTRPDSDSSGNSLVHEIVIDHYLEAFPQQLNRLQGSHSHVLVHLRFRRASSTRTLSATGMLFGVLMSYVRRVARIAMSNQTSRLSQRPVLNVVRFPGTTSVGTEID